MKGFLLLSILTVRLAVQAEVTKSNAPSIPGQVGDDLARRVQMAKQLEIGKADFVTYAGNDYSPVEALHLLPAMMKNQDEAERAKYFNAVARFGPKLKGELL